MLSARPVPSSQSVHSNAFRKSSRNPLIRMSRTATNKTTGHAPSTLMLERMHEAATDLVILATTNHGWRFTNERNGAMLYEMAGRNLPSNVSTAKKFGRGAGHSSDYYLVRAVTTVHLNVAAMLDLLHSSTTEEFRLIMKKIFGQYFENGVTVDKLTCTTPPPFAEDVEAGAEGARRSFSEDDAYSVNWLTLKAQAKAGKGETRRDFTLVSYQDAFSRHESGVIERLGRGTTRTRSKTLHYQPQNKLIGVHALSSVNFQDIPELNIPECTDRLHFRNSGFVIEETAEPNVLRLSLLLSLLPTKATLKYARKYQRWLQTLASCVGNLAHMLRPEVTLHCLSKHTWKQSDHCFMCLKMFRTFRRCHHCRFCGEAVCSACSSMVNMAGYDVTDGSGTKLTACTPNSPASSQRSDMENSQTGEAWQLTSGDGLGKTRSTKDVPRTFREARGCSACVADLRHGLATSAVVKSQRNSDSIYTSDTINAFNTDNSVLGCSRIEQSGRNEDDESVFDTGDDARYDRRLGSIATYIQSENGVGAIVEERPPYLSIEEPVDEFPVPSEELQDKFPAVNKPVSMPFRTTSDPDQVPPRMRNVSDPDYPQRLKDKFSLVSVSTASSSFSRSSNDRYTNDNGSQCSRGTNFSAMSDGNSVSDLSRDPDILALAGLKPRPSDDHVESVIQRPNQRTNDQMDASEEPERCYHQETGNRVPTSYLTADTRYYCHPDGTRDDLAVLEPRLLRPADVVRHRSQTTSTRPWNPIATAPQSSMKTLNAMSNHFASSGLRRGLKCSDLDTTVEEPSAAIGAAESTASVESAALIQPVETSSRLDGPGRQMLKRNDMIPLPLSTQASSNFVVFSDSRRESIFTRMDDGQDMIPLSF